MGDEHLNKYVRSGQKVRYIMTVSKKQQACVNKYVKTNYDRVNVTFPKGKKDIIKAHAEKKGESVNAFINRAIDETMERETET